MKESAPFFLLAMAATFFGFTGTAGLSSTTGWVVLGAFVVVFVLSLVVCLITDDGHFRFRART